MTRRLSLLLVWLVVACATAGGLPTASPTDLQRADRLFPGTTTDDLTEGRALYASHCGRCHAAIAPSHLQSAAWPEHVTEMKERAGLDDAKATLVERYLVTMGRP